MDSATIKIVIRQSNGDQFDVSIAPNALVKDLKVACKEGSGMEPEEMRLIHKGKILKDDGEQTIDQYNISDGLTVHLVKGKNPKAQEAPQTSNATAPTTGAAAGGAAAGGAAAGGAAAGGMGAAGSDPFAGMGGMGGPYGGMGGMGGMPPGGMGGMGGMPPGGMNPQMMQQMMQNPMVQQMLSDPQVMNQIISQNPMLKQMTEQNPQLRAMLNDPEMMRQMMNPAAMQQAMQMMQGGGMGGMGGMGGPYGGMGGMPGGAGGAGGNPFAGMDPAMMQAMMGGPMGGAAGAGAMPTATSAPADTRPPAEKYATQLQQIKEMGFNDDDAILQILEQTGGNVQLALEKLFQ